MQLPFIHSTYCSVRIGIIARHFTRHTIIFRRFQMLVCATRNEIPGEDAAEITRRDQRECWSKFVGYNMLSFAFFISVIGIGIGR